MNYFEFLLLFIVLPLVFLLILNIVQKSKSLWGAVLAHMIADALGILAVFGVI